MLHGAVSVTAVFLPDTLEAIAVGPVVGAPTFAQVGGILADETLAGPGRLGAPDVHASALPAVLHKSAFVAVAPGPGFHAFAVFEAFAELTFVLRRSAGNAMAVRQAVLATTFVLALQLRIDDLALRGHRKMRGESKKEKGKSNGAIATTDDARIQRIQHAHILPTPVLSPQTFCLHVRHAAYLRA